MTTVMAVAVACAAPVVEEINLLTSCMKGNRPKKKGRKIQLSDNPADVIHHEVFDEEATFFQYVEKRRPENIMFEDPNVYMEYVKYRKTISKLKARRDAIELEVYCGTNAKPPKWAMLWRISEGDVLLFEPFDGLQFEQGVLHMEFPADPTIMTRQEAIDYAEGRWGNYYHMGSPPKREEVSILTTKPDDAALSLSKVETPIFSPPLMPMTIDDFGRLC